MAGLILPYRGVLPRIDASAFIAPNATVIGDVEIGPEASIWFGVVIRGDVNPIRIGARTNIQDNAVIHATEFRCGTTIGADVTVGHSAILHACTVQDRGFVGMGACLLDEALVESDGMVAAGALLTSGKKVLGGELWAGNPAKKLRDLKDAERANILDSAKRYAAFGREYREQLG